MKTSAALFIGVAALAGVQALSATEAAPQVPAHTVLAQLGLQLEQIRSGRELKSADLKRPSLASLVGLHRPQLTSILGAPDYCNPPRDGKCVHSAHWAYFFYHSKPTTREAPDRAGTVQVTIPLQGWAVEINFWDSDVVRSAAWIWEE